MAPTWMDSKAEMITYLDGRYENAWDRAGRVLVHWGEAKNHWTVSDDHAAIWDILRALEDIGESLRYLSDDRASLIDPAYPMVYFLKNFTQDPLEAGSLTWEKIVNAWILAPLDGQQWTIGMIDYMRKVIWDKPYNFPLIPAEIGA